MKFAVAATIILLAFGVLAWWADRTPRQARHAHRKWAPNCVRFKGGRTTRIGVCIPCAQATRVTWR